MCSLSPFFRSPASAGFTHCEAPGVPFSDKKLRFRINQLRKPHSRKAPASVYACLQPFSHRPAPYTLPSTFLHWKWAQSAPDRRRRNRSPVQPRSSHRAAAAPRSRNFPATESTQAEQCRRRPQIESPALRGLACSCGFLSSAVLFFFAPSGICGPLAPPEAALLPLQAAETFSRLQSESV